MPSLRRAALVAVVVLAAAVLVAPTYASYKAKIVAGTLTITGNQASDKLVLRLKAGAATKVQVDVGANGTADFEFGRGMFTSIVVNAGGGNDRVAVSEANGIFTTTEATTLNGGGGKDRLSGGSGGETLRGGTGPDTLVGKDGPDTFFWKAGDGNDAIDGQNGTDVVNVAGTAGNDVQTLRESSSNLRVQTGSEVVVAEAVEGAGVTPLDGIDQVDVGDLTGAGVDTVDVGLEVGGAADGSADTVTLDGRGGGADVATATANLGHVLVNGFPSAVDISGASPIDRLTMNGLGGGDTLSGSIGLAALILLTLDGGDGADLLNGGNGADTIVGEAGNDTVDGNGGNDTIFLGADNDQATWDPGDASDIVEGQTGTDTLVFNGSAGAEIFVASSNGGRLLFTRNVGNIVMDVDDVENLHVNALGGTDTLTVNDLVPTDVAQADIDLGVSGAGDGAADAVTLNGSTGVDLVDVSGSAGSVAASTGPVTLTLAHAEPANDTATVNLSSGNDLFSASGLASSSVLLTVNGGTGDDILVGSQGNDTINGDANNDVIQGGNGNDTLNGGADTDYIDGGAGIDVASNGETVVNVP